jgi:E3 ubiquitin-protein ligase CCNP1IP1
MSADQDALRRKNEELGQSLRDKNRKLLQTQELYDKMKRRGMLDQVQNAASNAVDDTIQATVAGGGSANSDDGRHLRPQPGLFANQQNSASHNSGGFKNTSMQPPQAPRRRSGDWQAFNSQMNNGKENPILPDNTEIILSAKLTPI